MSSLESAYTPVKEIDAIYDRLQTRFASGVTRSLDYRVYNLKQLAYLIKENEDKIQACLRQDLDRGEFDTSMTEIFPIYSEIELALKRLPKWMKDEGRMWDAALFFKPMRPKIRRQPKGVALIISPWNFPWICALSPLVNAIAAGCPALIKPSELAPTSSALLAELIPRYLDSDAYAVVLGAVDETTALLEKPWGHILFTGSGRVGKIVAGAAAKTLTPTTLELGGKSPTIVAGDANMRLTARRMMSIKPISNSQICVSPDYILCVRDKLDDFVAACQETLSQFYPPQPHPKSAMSNPTTGALRSEHDYKRQLAFLDQAEKQGHKVIRGETDAEKRRLGISLVIMKDGLGKDDGGLMEEEIFGPVLPIIPVDSVDEAIEFINARPKPLALYVCSSSRATFKKGTASYLKPLLSGLADEVVIAETTSGHATWNDFSFVPIARSLPFGGVGESGWGSYHGYEGFKTFSHEKGKLPPNHDSQDEADSAAILELPFYLEPLLNIRYARTNPTVQKIIRLVLCAPVPYARPTSVENENWKRRVGVWRDRLLVAFLVLAIGCGAGSYLRWHLPGL